MDLGQLALAHWNRRWLADGIMLVPPENDGALRIRTGQRPLRPLHQLLGDAVVRRFERFATIEGEHAGMVDLGDPDGARYVAMIAGDESYVLVEGRTNNPARAAWFRDLVFTVARFYPLGLGRPRKRRYMYKPPANWQSLARSGCVVWIAPEFPQVSGRIIIHDARPLAWFAPGAVDRLLFIDESPFATQHAVGAPTEIVSVNGLGGTSTQASGATTDGTPITMLKTLLQDGRYYYATQLDARTSEIDSVVPVYLDLLNSIEPLPSSTIARSADQFMHWIE